MEKYIKNGKECYKGAELDSEFSSDLFHKPEYQGVDDDENFAFHSNLGSLTVLDRMTGFGGAVGGIRDTETGYRDINGAFWLASGNCDVRESGATTIGEAIEWVKKYANTCVGTETYK